MKDFSKYNTKELWDNDLKHNMHPFTDFSSFKKEGSLIMAESEGAYVFDTEGRKYLDGIAGLWCVNIGYGNEEMGQAMLEQTRRIPYYSSFGHLTTPPAVELSAKLASLAPKSLSHVFYGTGGSMSNDTAVRMVHFYFNRIGKPNKKQIITRTDGYHGSTYLSMTLTGVEYDHIGFDLAPDLVHRVSAPNVYRRPEGMTIAEYCDFLVNEVEQKILSIGPENVAMFVAEPIAGAGGVLVPPAGYHQRVAAVCKKYGVFILSDEVVTAFGRLGEMFTSEKIFGFTPDIITCAKGLTSGYIPLSANMISDEIYDVISVPQAEGASFTHGFTYSGHPVCCAVGLKNIEIMERMDLCGHVRDVGKYFEKQLIEKLSDLAIVGDVRGSHFMMCIESVANKETKALLDPNIAIGNRIADKCQAVGLLVRPLAHKNILSPPLTLTVAEVDFIVNTLHKAITDVQDDLVKEGLWHG